MIYSDDNGGLKIYLKETKIKKDSVKEPKIRAVSRYLTKISSSSVLNSISFDFQLRLTI